VINGCRSVLRGAGAAGREHRLVGRLTGVDNRTIGLLHPGEMGAAVGQCLVTGGHEVLWVPQGRSPATTARAGSAGLTGAADLTDLVRRADVIVSVCPPHAALDTARQVAAAGFGGLYMDANAISPATMREVAVIVADGGGDGSGCVDGGIIGTPPVRPGFIRLYLSGPQAGEVRQLFEGTPVDVRVVDHGGRIGVVGSASAVKMAYASWTKGSAALLLAARVLARAQGVEDVLLAEWGLSQPGLEERSGRAATSAAGKGWRWVAEMEEIAATMGAAGLPEGFHQAAAEIYRRAPHDAEAGLDTVLDALAAEKAVPER
jgi:3-hydroxyisobutyrate dehydrogenase-like beta-hydroxyacid dehydrogenase